MRCIHTLHGHRGEISSCQFNYTGELCISGSIDRTCKIWDVQSGQWAETCRTEPVRFTNSIRVGYVCQLGDFLATCCARLVIGALPRNRGIA